MLRTCIALAFGIAMLGVVAHALLSPTTATAERRQRPICTEIAKSIHDDRDTMRTSIREYVKEHLAGRELYKQLQATYAEPVSAEQQERLWALKAQVEASDTRAKKHMVRSTRVIREAHRDIRWGVRNGCLRDETTGSIAFRSQNRLWWRDLERAYELLRNATR